jgi:hypothetical protein
VASLQNAAVPQLNFDQLLEPFRTPSHMCQTLFEGMLNDTGSPMPLQFNTTAMATVTLLHDPGGPAPLQFNTTAMATVPALNEPGGTNFLPQLATPRLQQRANVLVHAAQPLDWKQSRKTGPFFVFVVDGTVDVRPKQWR